MKVAVLTGGVGGARFLRGIVDAVDPAAVTAIVNVGDDLEVLGLSVSPDLDSVLYALAGLADEERGWGRADETWNALAAVESLGGESWFRLGDRDMAPDMVDQLRLTRPYRSNLPTAMGPYTRLMYAGSFSAAEFYEDTIAVVKCPGCERSFVFRIYLYKDKLPNAQLFRIQGLGYEGSLPNGVGLVISERKIVGKMVYGTPACECEVLQTVEIE